MSRHQVQRLSVRPLSERSLVLHRVELCLGLARGVAGFTFAEYLDELEFAGDRITKSSAADRLAVLERKGVLDVARATTPHRYLLTRDGVEEARRLDASHGRRLKTGTQRQEIRVDAVSGALSSAERARDLMDELVRQLRAIAGAPGGVSSDG